MTKQLLLPGHMEHVAGFDAARGCFNHTYGGGQALTVVALGLGDLRLLLQHRLSDADLRRACWRTMCWAARGPWSSAPA